MTADRDPIDPRALAAAVTAWLTDDSDEADIALEAALLAQGVMNPSETVESFESDAYGVLVFFEGGEVIFLDIDGVVNPVERD